MTGRDYATPFRCPLCNEVMDATDMSIRYCSCEYRLCRLCWNEIMDKAYKEGKQGLCPNCRNAYDNNKLAFLTTVNHVTTNHTPLPPPPPPNHQMISNTMGNNNNNNNNVTTMIKKENAEEKKNKKTSKKKGNGINLTVKTRKQLQDLRILQRNLVYTVGLSMDICKEEVLAGNNYFAQFGKIKKISVNRNSTYSTGQSKNGPTGAAYVTYVSADDAARCVEAIDGAIWDGRYIRACFGTTKYCQAFLKGAQCNNPDCLYMHHIVHEGTCTKEEMSSGFANGKPDFYDLINFDRQKGPVPGSLANKPPKGPIVTTSNSISSAPFRKQQKDEIKKETTATTNSSNSQYLNTCKDLQDWPHLTSNANQSPDPNLSEYDTQEQLILPLMSRRSAEATVWPGQISNRTSKLMSTSSVPPPVTQNVSSSPKTPENQQQPYTVLNNSPIRAKILTHHMPNPSPRPPPPPSSSSKAMSNDLLRSKKSADDSIISANSQHSDEVKIANPSLTDVPSSIAHNNTNNTMAHNQLQPTYADNIWATTTTNATATGSTGGNNLMQPNSLPWGLLSRGSCDSFLAQGGTPLLPDLLENEQQSNVNDIFTQNTTNLRRAPPGYENATTANFSDSTTNTQHIPELLMKASIDTAEQILCNSNSLYDYQHQQRSHHLFPNDHLDTSLYNQTNELLLGAGPFENQAMSPFPSNLGYGLYKMTQNVPSLESGSSGLQPLAGAASLPNELIQTLMSASNLNQQSGLTQPQQPSLQQKNSTSLVGGNGCGVTTATAAAAAAAGAHGLIGSSSSSSGVVQETPQSILQNRMSVDVLDQAIYGFSSHQQKLNLSQTNTSRKNNIEDMKVLTNLLQQMQQPNMLHSRHSVDGSLLGRNISNNPLHQDSLFKDSFIYNYNNNNKITENAPSDHSPNTVSNSCTTKAPVSTSNLDTLSSSDNHLSNHHHHHHLHHQLQDMLNGNNMPVTPFAVPSSPPTNSGNSIFNISSNTTGGNGYVNTMPMTPFDTPLNTFNTTTTGACNGNGSCYNNNNISSSSCLNPSSAYYDNPPFNLNSNVFGNNNLQSSSSSNIQQQPLRPAFGSGTLWTLNPDVDADSSLLEGIKHSRGVEAQIP